MILKNVKHVSIFWCTSSQAHEFQVYFCFFKKLKSRTHVSENEKIKLLLACFYKTNEYKVNNIESEVMDKNQEFLIFNF